MANGPRLSIIDYDTARRTKTGEDSTPKTLDTRAILDARRIGPGVQSR